MVLLLFAKLATIAVPFTFKWATDALVGQGSAPVGPSSWLVWVLAAPILMTVAYGGMRILMAVLTQVRDGVFAKVAMHAVRRLAFMVFEHMHRLSLRFHLERKTGGLDARARARPQRHRDHRAHGDHAARADRDRALDHRRRAALPVRLALCRGHPGHRRLLHGVHLSRDRVAHQHPPPHERQRHRRQRQGDRLAAQLRDGEIFRRRGARSQALRPLDGALREGERRGLRLARRAQCRPGDDLHHRARHRDGDVRLRHQGRHPHRRRFRDDQRDDDPALPAAELHGHGLSRDQAGGDRHRDHVRDPRPQAGDRGQAGRAAAQGARRHGPVRERHVLL